MARLLVLIHLLLAAVLSACASTPERPPRPLLILVSIDGFRPDYLDRGVTPVLSALAVNGVRGVMRPSFPTKTFPNHYTLVTGLRPDRHGIVANNMRDPAIPGVAFSMSNRVAVQDARWWEEAEPIWVTAERAGIATAPLFWPGSEAPIRGIRPRHHLAFDMAVSSQARVDRGLALLDRPTGERPGFMTVYFDVVDTAGHRAGPDTPGTDAALREVDAALGSLFAGLKAKGIAANVVIVSDHGMAPRADDRRLFLDDWLPRDAYTALDLGPMGAIYPEPGREAEVARALLRPRPHLQCWRKADIPARFHYGRHRRVAPIFCLPETGWALTTRDRKPEHPEKGDHGYDNFSPEMAAVFVANGPAFRIGVRPPVFDNVDVYPLLARLLGVRAPPNDGDLEELGATLR